MIGAPWTGELPFVYHGVLHRTLQYFEHTKAEVPFKELGYANGGFGVYSVQATSIGPYAHLPQGWPFSGDDGHKLIATLSSFYFRGKWPLCDVPRGLQIVDGDGSVREMGFGGGRDFGIGDAGAIWIYRDDEGEFRLDGACG